MNKKIMYAGGLVLLVIIAVLLSTQQKNEDKKMDAKEDAAKVAQESMETKPEDFGTYSYMCDNGAEFSMMPSNDATSLTLTPGVKATFSKTTLTKKESSTGARYEGNGLVFVGAGEGVKLTIGGTNVNCNPKPNSELAPFNFGDSGEGGGVKQNLVAIVGDNLKGKWVSVDDPKFVREFADMGVVWDFYDGKQVADGRFQIFSKTEPLEVPFTIAENTSYIQLVVKGSQTEKINFKVDKLTPEELELTYMDRGGVLKLKRMK